MDEVWRRENVAAAALLDAIDAWVVATKCTSGELGQMVLNHGGFVPLLRKRGTLREDTDRLVRAFMAIFPDAAALPRALVGGIKTSARARMPWKPEEHHAMMVRLGYPEHPSLGRAEQAAPIREAKPRIRGEVIRAAKLDGRALPEFVTALIDMGLECWRDDRAAHGEAVA